VGRHDPVELLHGSYSITPTSFEEGGVIGGELLRLASGSKGLMRKPLVQPALNTVPSRLASQSAY